MKKIIGLAVVLALCSCKSEKKDSENENYITPTLKEEDLTPEVREGIARGAKIYNNFCATCHLASGEGIPNAFPPINQSDWLQDRKATIHAVKFGLRGPITVNGIEYNSLMADLNLTDQEVTDVVNYIFTAWDNSVGPPVTLEEVERLKKDEEGG